MPTRRKKSARSRVAAAAGGASWMALLAATTLGVGQYDYVNAEISSDGNLDMDPGDAGEYRWWSSRTPPEAWTLPACPPSGHGLWAPCSARSRLTS